MEYIITCCVSPSMRIGFVAKMADTFLFKKSRDHVKMVEKYVDESMDIVQRSDTTDPSYLPEVNGAVDFALEGLQQNLINVEEIKGEVMHLFTAAFDTTSYTLFLAVVLLAMHSEFQERAHEEIVSILGDDDKELTVEQLDQMVFLEMVFNETLRLFPAGPTIARQVSHENVTLTNGLTLPVGQTICIDTYSLHRDKDIWGPAANSFNPENFLPSNVETRHAYAYIPFTKGVRFCIGWKYAYLFAKVTLAKAIKHFKFSTDAKYEELVAENQTTLKLIKDPQIFLEKRT